MERRATATYLPLEYLLHLVLLVWYAALAPQGDEDGPCHGVGPDPGPQHLLEHFVRPVGCVLVPRPTQRGEQ